MLPFWELGEGETEDRGKEEEQGKGTYLNLNLIRQAIPQML